MTFDEYQQRAAKTAIYPDQGRNLTYTSLGLAGEAGEYCNKVKKIQRDQAGVLTPETRKALKAELGDLLWYLAACARELQISLGDIATENIESLAARQARGTLSGSGDHR